MNVVLLTGRLGKEPEMRNVGTDKTVCKFSIAVNSGKDVDWHEVVTWNKTAENVAKYCKKGSLVAISGELKNRSWVKSDGTKGYATEVVASRVEFLDKADKGPAVESDVLGDPF